VTRTEFEDQDAVENMDMLIELIRAVRTIRSEADRPLSKTIDLLIRTKGDKEETFLKENESFIRRFCNPDQLVIEQSVDVPEEVKVAVVTGAEVFIPLAGLVDFKEEIKRLEKEQSKWQSEITRVEKKLANEKFVQNAPDSIVEEERAKGREYQEKYDSVTRQLAKMKEIEEDNR
jgi:valyl-tRNA synthetase